jgi:organic radical activating enzyme
MKSLDIYVAGCSGNPHCVNCHNTESWDFTKGTPYLDAWDGISRKLDEFGYVIDNIMIMGGEPLDQDWRDFLQLLRYLERYDKDIWLFTRKSLEEVPSIVKHFCSYIKTGRYLKDLPVHTTDVYGIRLSSINQQIHKKGKDYA